MSRPRTLIKGYAFAPKCTGRAHQWMRMSKQLSENHMKSVVRCRRCGHQWSASFGHLPGDTA